MKKLLALLLGLLVLAGCGAPAAPTSGVTQEEYDKVVAERDALQARIDELKGNQVSQGSPVVTLPPADISDAVFQDLLISESGYFPIRGSDQFYIQYAIVLENPNSDIAVEFPRIRITARDESNAILATDEQVFGEILPGGVIVYASQGPSVEVEPARVDIEVVPPDEHDKISPEFAEYPNLIPLEAINLRKGEDNITGEIINSNDFQIDTACVTAVFRDESGALISGDLTFIDSVPAGGGAPFEIGFGSRDVYFSERFEVYAYPW